MWLPLGLSLLPTSLLLLATALQSTAFIPTRTPQEVGIDVTQAARCSHKTKNGDRISVHYNGTLEDGTLFDSSYSRNEPIEFTIGYAEVIKGWELGLLDMCQGEARTLTIPPSLAYGNRAVGPIPAGSTLIFDTKLVAINGVTDPGVPTDVGDFSIQTAAPQPPSPADEQAEAGAVQPTPTGTSTVPSPTVSVEAESQLPVPLPTGTVPTDPSRGDNPGSVDGECRLLGPFALLVQAGLGFLALFSLVFKRWRERPRRPFKIWFFDASKQVFGSALLHILNLLMSIFTQGDFDLAHKAQAITAQFENTQTRSVNPCSWYLINIAIDTTIGIPILVIFLRLLHHGARLTPLARPVESIKSGHYGQPPRATWWLKQSLLYFIGLGLMKLCVFFIILLLPWIALVGDWALRWTEGSEALQLAFVMFVFPLIMNALQYYIIDSFIKDPSGGVEATEETSSQPSYHSVDGRDSFDSELSDGDEDATKTAEAETRTLTGSSNDATPTRNARSRERNAGKGEHAKQV